MRDRGVRWSAAVAVGLAIAAVGSAPPSHAARAGRARSRGVIDCSQAGTRVTITASSTLDPTCTYTAGFDITTSGITLDCAGATIRSAPGAGGTGVLVSTPVDVDLHDVVVRNCHVEGFLNSLRVTRDGFRALPAGQEYDHGTSDIVVEDSTFTGSRGVGVFIDGYVRDVTVRRNTVRGAGSSGIYLDGGSKENRIEDNEVLDNGFRENGPGGQTFSFGGTSLWFWGVGREGLSIDGSSKNLVLGNHFRGNSNGGVFVYKNCGEFPNSGRYFERRTPSDRNAIQGNVFDGGRNGVWVGSRMAENTLPMECTDPAYIDEPARRVVLDHATRTLVAHNTFNDVIYGVRVEDDQTQVRDNTFSGAGPDRHAVVVGTPLRAEVLHEPVRNTVLERNTSTIAGNDDPYRWIPGTDGIAELENTALGHPSPVCEGRALPRQTFIFVLAVAPDDGSGTKPPTPDLTYPTVGVLPPCARSGSSTTSTTAPVTPAEPPAAAPAGAVSGSPSFTG